MTQPPPARREDVVDILHGVEVPDPYRWLEDGDAAEVRQWVSAQNEHTRQALDARPDRDRWHERLVALMQLPVVAAVQVRGPHLFCLERPAGAEQFLLTRRSSSDPDAPPVVLLDPAVGTADAASAVDWFHASPDGALIAVGTSEAGSEDSVLRVLATADGADRGEAIPSTRACSLAWEPDGSGFAYTRYPEGEQYHRTVHHHVLGAHWEDDAVIWAEHPDPQAWPDVTISPDGAWLVVHVMVGWSRIDVHLLERATGAWTTVISGQEATTALHVAADGASLVGITTHEAPRGRIVQVALDAPQPEHWVTIVAEGDAVLERVAVCGDELLVVATRRAVDTLRRYRADGRSLGPLDGLGDVIAVVGLSADRDTGQAFVLVDSFGAPTSVTPSLPRHRPPPPFAVAAAGVSGHGVVPDMTVSQLSYPSTDARPSACSSSTGGTSRPVRTCR
jgi:prolyl oligopeptidase